MKRFTVKNIYRRDTKYAEIFYSNTFYPQCHSSILVEISLLVGIRDEPLYIRSTLEYFICARPAGSFRVHLEHWPSNPLVKGSYTCNHPGYFTSIAGNEAKQVGNLYFAGEHTSSFYEFQGFMEGAALSGIRAAREILQDLKVGILQ